MKREEYEAKMAALEPMDDEFYGFLIDEEEYRELFG